MKSTGLSPYINTVGEDLRSGLNHANAQRTVSSARELDAVKGTGFSPYIKCSKINGASAPEGKYRDAGPLADPIYVRAIYAVLVATCKKLYFAADN